jgi:hypothetical protein
MVKKLVEHGSPLDTISNSGECPITLSVATLNLYLVEYLLGKGANPNPNQKAKHPLEAARELKSDRIINILTLAGARDVARRPRSSKQQQRTSKQRTDTIHWRVEADAIREQGACYVCGETEELYKVLPCGHSVVCPDCLEFFTTYMKSCPTCKLNYFATRKA